MLSRGDAIALQRSADVLVLLTSPTLVWELPGKVFEYFGARRPILALAKDNEAARLVEETGMLSFPQILVGDTLLGGFQQLVQADRSGRLAELTGQAA